MISVIIPFTRGDKERQDGLNILFDCIKKQTFRDFELIVVEMTQDGTGVYLPYKPTQHILLPYKGVMSKSWVCNVGARNASNNGMLFIDADTQFEEGFFASVFDFWDRMKKPFFLAWNKCVMLEGRDEPTPRLVEAWAMKAAAHAWFVEKETFWKIGGMNEKYFGYGAEDQDFWERGMHILKDIPNMPYNLKHIYHHFHPKDSAYPLNDKRVPLKEETMQFIDREIEWLVKNQDKLGRDKPFTDRSNW